MVINDGHLPVKFNLLSFASQMKRFLAGFFLPLSILLLNGYGLQYAYAYQDNLHSSTNPTVDHAIFITSQDDMLASGNATLSDKSDLKIVITDVEEDETKEHGFVSFKRNATNNSYAVALFYLALIGFAFGHIKKSLLSCKHISCHSNNKWYLQLSVLRI